MDQDENGAMRTASGTKVKRCQKTLNNQDKDYFNAIFLKTTTDAKETSMLTKMTLFSLKTRSVTVLRQATPKPEAKRKAHNTDLGLEEPKDLPSKCHCLALCSGAWVWQGNS